MPKFLGFEFQNLTRAQSQFIRDMEEKHGDLRTRSDMAKLRHNEFADFLELFPDTVVNSDQQQQQQVEPPFNQGTSVGREAQAGPFPVPPSVMGGLSPMNPGGCAAVRQVNGDVINMEILQIPFVSLEGLKGELGLTGKDITVMSLVDKVSFFLLPSPPFF